MICRALLFLAVLAPLVAQTPPAKTVSASAPFKNFRLPGYDTAGRRTRLLTGSEARNISATQVEVVDMKLALYVTADPASPAPANGATPPTDTLIEAPFANVQLKDKEQPTITGDQSVHITRDDLDATGEKWMYIHGKLQKKLWIGQNVRVVFKNTEFSHLLK